MLLLVKYLDNTLSYNLRIYEQPSLLPQIRPK